ncbi:LamG domain-containing protein [Capilliphycus salinus ALCB114379]|uniref:LamG domain-containing protein n=1 Tax=Capilliphycus salinus TaxID=2768948 RepID=UPI0039A41CCC
MSIFFIRKKSFALLFDGVDDYVEIKNNRIINQIGSGDFTLSAIVYALESEQKLHPQILSNRQREGTGFLFGFHGRWRGSQNKIPFVQYNNTNWIDYQNQPNLLNNQWHHFVARKYQNNITYFADGKKIASFTSSRIVNYNISSRHPLLIGWDSVNPSATHFKGKIDEVSIWNRALSNAEIQSGMLKSIRGRKPGLISYWSFEEGSGNIVRDYSGNGNHGMIFGAVWTTGWLSECR